MLQRRVQFAPHSRAPITAERIKHDTDGDDGEGRKARARPRRNRSARREIQGNPAEVRTRAQRVLRDDLGQRDKWNQPAFVLALSSRNLLRRFLQKTPKGTQENSAERISRRQERSRCLDVFFSVQATLREVKARKTPSASSDVGGVFVWRATSVRAISSHAIGQV